MPAPRTFVALLALICICSAEGAFAQPAAAEQAAAEKPAKLKPLKVGDLAPEFSGRTDEDKPWKSADHVGKKIVVVYFYPADMTGGCTAQACAYRDVLDKIERDDVEVVGVSGDSVENHRMFKKMHGLNFTLLADPKGKIAKAFGVQTGAGGAIQREFEGAAVELKRGVTASRWTFVIGPDKKIVYKDTKVDAANDPAKVLKAIETIKRVD